MFVVVSSHSVDNVYSLDYTLVLEYFNIMPLYTSTPLLFGGSHKKNIDFTHYIYLISLLLVKYYFWVLFTTSDVEMVSDIQIRYASIFRYF